MKKRRIVLVAVVAATLATIVPGAALLAWRWHAFEARGKSTKEIEWLVVAADGERALGFGNDGMFQVERENALDRLLGPRRVRIDRNALQTAMLPGGRDALVVTPDGLVRRELDGDRPDRDVRAEKGIESIAVARDGRRYAFLALHGVVFGELGETGVAGPFVLEDAQLTSTHLLLSPDGEHALAWSLWGSYVHAVGRRGVLWHQTRDERDILSVSLQGDTVLVVTTKDVSGYALATGEPRFVHRHDTAQYAFASATGLLAHLDPGGMVSVRALTTGRRLYATWRAEPKARSVGISEDGSTLAIGRVDGSVEVHALNP